VGLLGIKLPGAMLDAGAVADFFLKTLFPGEGEANLREYRRIAIEFLNTADNGTTASPFAQLTPTSATYRTRLRGMVAFLMTTPRFQEQ
jgi:hypothetical protein